MPTAPDLDAVKAYLSASGVSAPSYSDAEIEQELNSEVAAQGRVCRIPADADPGSPQPYPADLAKALLRRVARALVLRGKPLGYQPTADGGQSYISANDPEIRRLESPFRKRPIR